MTEKAFERAEKYIRKQGFDCIERAGEKNGMEYFHFWSKASEGHKVGLPLIIKVSTKTGRITLVHRLEVIMWAIQNCINNISRKKHLVLLVLIAAFFVFSACSQKQPQLSDKDMEQVALTEFKTKACKYIEVAQKNGFRFCQHQTCRLFKRNRAQ